MQTFEPTRFATETEKPIFNAWTFWFHKKVPTKRWNECLHEVATCNTFDEFLLLFKSIKPPSYLGIGCDYAFFRSSIRPIWEDEENQNGGRWIITLDKHVNRGEVNKLWMDTLQRLVNETLIWKSCICGVVFSNRWNHRKIGKTKKFEQISLNNYFHYFHSHLDQRNHET